MILTVTPNPSVDRTLLIDALARGQVIRARRSSSEPSGKGVNVALALHGQGIEVLAVLPVGGHAGTLLSRMLAELGLATHEVAIAADVRTNVSLVEPDGTVTKVNEPGPELTGPDVDALVHAVEDSLAGVDWLVCCGSLPPGAPVDLYARLVDSARAAGVRAAVDTSGAPLRAALAAGPDLVKPNCEELAELVGARLDTVGDVVDAADSLRAEGSGRSRGPGAVLVSIGADGALLVDSSGALHAEAGVAEVVSAVGAGDALLAGFVGGLAGRAIAGPTRAAALSRAVAWGAAAVGQVGTVLPASAFAGVDRHGSVIVHESVDRSRRLREPGPA